MADLFTPTAIIVGMLNFYTTFSSEVNHIDIAELKCMADNIYFEARTQIGKGQRAVAHVTLNRVRNKRFPNTVCGVVKQGRYYKSGRPVKNRCQFSWFCDGKSDKIYLVKTRGKHKGQTNPTIFSAYTYAVSEAISAMSGLSVDPTFGATHYYAHKIVTPHWAKKFKKLVIIQGHTFMRPYKVASAKPKWYRKRRN